MAQASNDNRDAWATAPVEVRADMLAKGLPYPGETAAEVRCRLKAQLDLYDDDDLAALLGVTTDALARYRVDGSGPTPIRVARVIFYRREDVASWLARHRDAVVLKRKSA